MASTIMPVVLVRSKVAQYINGRAWLNEYQCSQCGVLRVVTASNVLRFPKCHICGIDGHGCYHDPRYRTWKGMRSRCGNPNDNAYARYGGRGIAVCDAWQTFRGFMAWNKFEEWRPGLCLDRIDNNGDYEPENCRWTTYAENNQNRSSTKLTPDDVRVIRMLAWSGLNNGQIARIFEVRKEHIQQIVTYKKWRNI